MSKRNGPVVYPPDGQRAAEGRQEARIVRDQEKAEPVRRASLVAWVSLLVVWVVWGSTYLAIKVGVETIPPLLLAAARNLIARLIMFPLTMRGRRAAAGDAARGPGRAGRSGWAAPSWACCCW